VQAGVSKILLPDIDASHRTQVLALAQEFPNVCLPMFGIHPTSIKDDYLNEIALLEAALKQHSVIAIGEIGIDLYWDKTFCNQQVIAFLHQMKLAQHYNLPVVIHVRDAFNEIFEAL
jgi:TatD DNase family protein